jgi:large subunit ribosomal protein L15
MNLDDLRPARGAHKESKRVGRGYGSGKGKTGGRGSNGQKARAGSGPHRAFEGGQNQITRRLPYKRGVGFFNRYSVTYAVFNIGDIAESQIEEITPDTLVAAGLIKNTKQPVKILGDGDISRPLRITAHKFSASAQQKIEAAGGTITTLPWTVVRRPRNR